MGAGGRPAKGPRKHIQFEDDQQLAAIDQAAAEDGVTRSELVRQFIAYGLAMRGKARDSADAAGEP